MVYGDQMENWLRRGSARTGEEAALTDKQLASRRAASMGMDEVADRAWNEARRDPGILFARKQQDQACPLKDEAREDVLTLFGAEAFPHRLTILTMPGVLWRFEHYLLHQRRQAGVETCVRAVERTEATYRAALRSLPYRQSGVRVLPSPTYATAAVSTHVRKPGGVVIFERCHFEDLAVQDERGFNGAWLDFNGPITAPRMRAIKVFWERRLRGGDCQRLVVTALDGREDTEGAEQRHAYGGVAQWLASTLTDATLLHERHYAEPAAMVQVAFERSVEDARP